MKKTWISVIVTFLLMLTACSGGSSSTATNSSDSENNTSGSNTSEKDEIVIGFSNLQAAMTPFTAAYEETFKAYAEELGVKTIILDSQNDTMTQLNNIDSLIQQQVDAIIVWPVDGKGIIPGLQKAKQAGIPVLSSVTYVDEAGMEYLAGGSSGNNIRQGELSAELLVKALGGKGKVVEITGTPGYQVTTERTEAIARIIGEKSDIEIMETQATQSWSVDEAQAIMENFLTKYPDIDGVVTHSDTIAAGAINALEAAGRLDGVAVTSAALFAIGYDNIKAGKQYGAVIQNPNTEAKVALDLALKVLKGEKIEKVNDIETPVITKDTVNDFEKPNW